MQCSFQGLTVQSATHGAIPVFDAAFGWDAFAADREGWYDAHAAAGDTHVNLAVSSQYDEPNQFYAGIPGKDYSQDLPALHALIDRTIQAGVKRGLKTGFKVLLMLAGDGESNPNGGYNDPAGMTYGHQWLVANFPRIFDALKDLSPWIVWCPGYDGCVPGWQPPSAVDTTMLSLRRVIGEDGALGVELAGGYSSWGDGGANWTSPAGQAIDVVLSEFPYPMGPPTPPPANICERSNEQKAPYYQVWQIVARLVNPYLWPADEPACADSAHPPCYLAGGTPRGPFYYVAFEYDTYGWVRGYPLAMVEAHRAYLRSLGCAWVG